MNNLVPRVFSLAWGPPSQGKDPGNEVASVKCSFTANEKRGEHRDSIAFLLTLK